MKRVRSAKFNAGAPTRLRTIGLAVFCFVVWLALRLEHAPWTRKSSSRVRPWIDLSHAYFPGDLEPPLAGAEAVDYAAAAAAAAHLNPKTDLRGSWAASVTGKSWWHQERDRFAALPFSTVDGSDFTAVEHELERSTIRPDKRHARPPPAPLARLGVVAVALDSATLHTVCRFVSETLPDILRVPHTVRGGHAGPTTTTNPPQGGGDGTPSGSSSSSRLVSIIVIAGPSSADWRECAALLGGADFAVVLAPSALASYSDAVETAAAHFDDRTSHVLAFDAGHGRLQQLLSPVTLRRVSTTLDTSACALYSCVDVASDSGVVESAGLEAIVSLEGSSTHFSVAHYGGYLLSSLNNQNNERAASAKMGSIDYFTTDLVRPTCMVVLQELLSRFSVPAEFAPSLDEGGVVRSAAVSRRKLGVKAKKNHGPANKKADDDSSSDEARLRAVLSVAEARHQLMAKYDAMEESLLRVVASQVGLSSEQGAAFALVLRKATQWLAAGADMLRETGGGVSQLGDFRPRETFARVPAGDVLSYLVHNTTDLALAVIASWQAQRHSEVEAARHTPHADGALELALRLAAGGRSCPAAPALVMPVDVGSSVTNFSTALAMPVDRAEYDPVKLSAYLTLRAGPQLASLKPRGLPVVAWYHQCCYCCGFSNEIVHLAVPLQRDYTLLMMSSPECFCDGFPTYSTSVINTTVTSTETFQQMRGVGDQHVIWISHTTPMHFQNRAFECNPPSYFVGRSMFEFSVVPKPWLSHAIVADEIWVPSIFVRDAFLASGFKPSSLVLVPEAIDTDLFTPHRRERYVLPHCTFAGIMDDSSNLASNIPFADPVTNARAALLGQMLKLRSSDVGWSATSAFNYRGGADGVAAATPDPFASERDPTAANYKFLAAFKWEVRKGWDVLLRAFFRAFKRSDGVSLYIATSIFYTEETGQRHTRDAPAVLSWILNVSDQMNIDRRDVPHIFVITANLAEAEVAALYRSVDAFVLPTRGEGWGLPPMQAMASGLPTIATNYSGQVDFLEPSASFPIRVLRLEPVPFQHVGVLDADARMKWAVPDEDHLVELLRRVHQHPEAARAVGRRARAFIASRYSEQAVYRQYVRPQLERIEKLLDDRERANPRKFIGRLDC